MATRAFSARVSEGAPRDAAKLRIRRRWRGNSWQSRRWDIKRKITPSRAGGSQSEGGAREASNMPRKPGDRRRQADRASQRYGVVRGRVKSRVRASCLSEARTVKAVTTREMIPLVERLMAHGMANKGTSTTLTPRLRITIQADGACMVKCRIERAMSSGTPGGLEEGVESVGLDRAGRANVTPRVA